MKKLYLLLLLGIGLLLSTTQAQVNVYSFSQTLGTYTPITGTLVGQATDANPGATPESASMDDHTYAGIALPFNFFFNGSNYSSLNINTNGWVSFGATTTSVSTPISSTNTYDNVISASSVDLMGIYATTGTRTSGSNILTDVPNTAYCRVGAPIQGVGIPAGTTITAFDATTITMSAAATAAGTAIYVSWATGEIRTEVTGTAPNRTFTIQYSGMSLYSASASATTNNTAASFQVKLNEGGGNTNLQTVQVVYDNYYRAGGTSTLQVGLRGAVNTDYFNRSTTTDWAASTAGPSNSATNTWSSTVRPVSGLTYSWTPSTEYVDWCNLQFPATATIPVGGTVTVYSQGWEPGVTDQAGAGVGITVWIGINGSNTDPATWTNWIPATFNVDVNNNDEFSAAIGATLGAGTYYYASRWRLNTGAYRYGGYNAGGGGYWNGTGNVNGELTITPAIANDICSGATSLSVNPDFSCTASTAGTTVGATQSPDVPAPTCSATGINDDVWFSFVATSTGHRVAISGATNQATSQVYRGACGSLVAITCGNTTTGALNQDLSGLTLGNTYYVRVYSTVATAATTTNFTICIGTLPPPPANDNICGAVSLNVSAGTTCTTALTGQTTQFSTQSLPGCAGTADEDVWYSFIATSTTHYITLTNSGTGSTDRTHQLFSSSDNTCNGTLTSITCSDPETSTSNGLTVGNTYFLRVHSWGSTTFATFDICVTSPASCPAATGVAVGSITASSASVAWTGTGSYILEYGPTGFTPGTGATAGSGSSTVINPATSPQALAGLTGSTAYQVYVRQNCTGAGNGYSANSAVVAFTTNGAPPANDAASGATQLTVGSGCTAAPYSNVNATQAAEEKFASCYQSATTGTGTTIATHTVWFKFTATSTAVKISTDIAGGTLSDTHLGLFSASNASDYSTFNILSCDDDNGSVGGVRSILYATGLTVGLEYFASVDGYNGTTGTFCIAVDNLTGAMLSAGNTCTSTYQAASGTQTTYAGQVPLVDASGNLVAIVSNPAGGSVSAYTAAQYINTAAVRQSPATGTYYMNRNFRIANASATNAQVQFFFLASELASLNAADGVTTLGNLAVTRQVETVAGCQNNYAVANGPVSLLAQTGNGTSADGLVNWVAVTTPGFSNFYLNNVGQVLPVTIEYFRGNKQNNRNLLDWKVACYNSPTVTLTVERSSDGRNFAGLNTTTETAVRCLQPFSYSDGSPLPGLNYYRLKSIDIDGKVSYSNMVALLNKDKGFEIVGLAPNPVHNKAILNVTSAQQTIMEIVVSDLNGKQFSKQRVSLATGNNQVSLNLTSLAGGTYQVSGLTGDGQIRSLRFVKQ